MAIGDELHVEKKMLYGDLAVAYSDATQVTQEFYPLAKHFLENTEPELDRYLKSISGKENSSINPNAYQAIFRYISSFDDFILSANKYFGESKKTLAEAEALKDRFVTWPELSQPAEYTEDLVPQSLSEILTRLKELPLRAQELIGEMKRLEARWAKTKEKVHI